MIHTTRSLVAIGMFFSFMFVNYPTYADGTDRLLTVRDHEPLWVHCVTEWSAEAFGDTWCAWAIVNGYPRSASGEGRSCAKAIELGIGYFPLLQVPRKVAGLYCAIAVEAGPTILGDW